MMLPDGIQPPEFINNESNEVDKTTAIANALASSKIGRPQQDNKSPCLFSVNLGEHIQKLALIKSMTSVVFQVKCARFDYSIVTANALVVSW